MAQSMRSPSESGDRRFEGPDYQSLQAPKLRVVKQAHYTEYLDPALPLEERLNAAFIELEINPAEQARLRDFLAPLKQKHHPTYEHCIRVGLLNREIANFLQLDQKAALYSGILHDVGKALMPVETLDKTEGWTKEDSKEMEAHVIAGYKLVADAFDFSADIIVWHHRFQPNKYPKVMPKPLHDYSEATMVKIREYGRILAIADVFDALHRINSRHGERRGLSGEEIKAKMMEYNSDSKNLIKRLYKNGVLTTFIHGEPHEETESLDEKDDLHAESFQYTDTDRSIANTRRHIAISCALEAIADKAGCTSRYQNVSRHLLLEYFVTAGINIADAFGRMAEAINSSDTCPENLYQFAAQAQLESKRNRRGGRVNQGMIELLAPIVATQHLHDPEYKLKPAEILTLAFDYMNQTTRSDVDSLRKLKDIGHKLSHYADRKVPEHVGANNVKDYYEMELLGSDTSTSVAHNGEFLKGFPTILDMCNTFENCPYPHFMSKVKEAFTRARAAHDSEVSAGFLADCVAVATYLYLSQNPTARVFG
ncbi:MAG: HD domain-containing protein [Bdellovibrionota bacterium]